MVLKYDPDTVLQHFHIDEMLATTYNKLPKPKVSQPKQSNNDAAARYSYSGDELPAIIKYIDKLPPSIENQNGSDACFDAALKLMTKFNLTEDEAISVMMEHYNPKKATPQWSLEEIRHKVSDAANSIAKGKSKSGKNSKDKSQEMRPDGLYKGKFWVSAPFKVEAIASDGQKSNPHFLISFEVSDYKKEIMMPTAYLFSNTELPKFLDKAGLAINPNCVKNLVEYLFRERIRVPHNIQITYTCGWQPSDVFMAPDGSTYGAGSELVRPSSELQASLDEDNVGGTPEGQQAAMKLACGNPWFQFVVSIAFAGPLVNPTGSRGVGFHVWAKSGRGKSISALLSASVWQDPYPLQNWRNTANALEGLAIRHNDGFMVLDEIQTIVKPDDLDEASYLLANGKQKGRMNADSSLRKIKSWAIVYLSTGEYDYETALVKKSKGAIKQAQSGQEVRLINIHAPETDMGLVTDFKVHGFESSKEYVDAVETQAREHYGHIGKAYAAKLAQEFQKDPEGFKVQLRQTMDEWKSTVQKGGIQVNRCLDSFALIACAGNWATSQGLLPWGEDDAFKACELAYKAFLEGRGSTIDGEDLRILKAILRTVQTQSNRFAAAGCALSTVQHCLGRQVNVKRDAEGNSVYDYDFTSEGLREVCGCGIDRILATLIAHGWLEVTKNGNSIKTTVQGEQWRFYRVLHDKVSEFERSLDPMSADVEDESEAEVETESEAEASVAETLESLDIL